MPYRRSQSVIGVTWVVGTVFLGALVFFQTSNYYSDLAPAVWDWFIPHVAPTLGLVIAGIVARWDAPARAARPLLFWVTLLVAVAHLSAVGVALAGQVPAADQLEPLEELTHLSNASRFLGVLQGALDGLLAYFFVRGQDSG